MSGSRGINSHLSEWLSEILEPIALNMASAEVNSTEEALAKIDQLNSCLDTDKTLDRLDPLINISIVTDHELRPETAREKINRTEVFKFSGDDDYKLNTTATAQGQDDYVMKNEMNKISEEGHLIEDILYDLGMEARKEKIEEEKLQPDIEIKQVAPQQTNFISTKSDLLQTKIKSYFGSLRETVANKEPVQCIENNETFNRSLLEQYNKSCNWAEKDRNKFTKLLPNSTKDVCSDEIFESSCEEHKGFV